MSAIATETQQQHPFREGLFVEAAADGRPRLVGSRCSACGVHAFPKRVVCGACGARDGQEEVLLGPEGTLYTFAVVRNAPKPFVPPYTIGYVDLDERVRVFTQILGDEDTLALGTRMELVVDVLHPGADGEGDVVTYKFRPVTAG